MTAHDLKAGKVKSCGCMIHDRDYNRVDLTGRRFGRLTAMWPTAKRDRKDPSTGTAAATAEMKLMSQKAAWSTEITGAADA